jgi:aquaporin Z
MNELVESGTIANEGLQRQRKTVCRHDALNALRSLHLHWPEYLMEAGELALYMSFACAFATLLQHPASPVRHFIINDVFRRALMGLAMVRR